MSHTRKPLIGITCNWRLQDDEALVMMEDAYALAVSQAGGVPVLIAPNTDAEALAEMLDGLLIPGGADIDPRHYGEEPHPETRIVNAPRFEQEWNLLRAFEARRKPVLGICYGCQLLNVWRGGSLYQHLPDLEHVQLRHQRRQREESVPRHFVRIEPHSKLAQILGMEQTEVVSAHHQAIREPGKNLKVVACSPDSVVEAVEDPSLPFFIGVQWHPERDPDAPATRALFRAFVRACLEE
ncbi:MAG: gamma-glutamyl-gamma-aminobutyrate hydrolase family protein [Fimbriimonadales bacterium]|nr:gamma-glutamyl-gamma-aminobutyrate hydrolase family protein [Fimbriimonadales bacterium]